MKELSIAEKAKRYDKAINAIKELKEKHPTALVIKDWIKENFPELVESDDERIRKALVKYFTSSIENPDYEICGVPFKKVLAWLEKQGKKDEEILVLKDQIESLLAARKALKEVHKIELEKQGEQKSADKVEPKFKAGDKVLVDGKVYTIKLVNEDNYIVDENGREVQEHFSYTKCWKLYEQNSAWSEEDETALGNALWCCKQAASIAKDENDMGNVWYAETWLKSLKDRVQPQPKQELSEEDERSLQIVFDILDKEEHKGNLSHADLKTCVRKLKSLRPQSQWKPSDEQMRVLDLAIRCGINRGTTEETTLVSLFNDLKKIIAVR